MEAVPASPLPHTINSSEDQQQKKRSPSQPSPPVAALSLSLCTNLSLSKYFPIHPLIGLPAHIKIPPQIFSLTRLSFSSCSSTTPTRPSSLPSSTPALLSSHSAYLRRRPVYPSGCVAARRCALLWFRCDLRVHDNEALSAASNEALSVLPVYLFDPRDYGKSSSGFDKTGPYRATFLLQSVADLRRSLRARGSDLVVRIGRPENVLVELARSVGADAVYMHREVSNDEARAEERVEKAMEKEGVEVKYFWGSTLYHIDDLPFELEQMPSNYGGFREIVQGLNVRKTIEVLDQIKGLPSRGDVQPGEIPTLTDLGVNPAPAVSQDGKPAVNTSLVGGETDALERVRKFSAECCAQPNKGSKSGTQESIYGANFSCKISPWLAMGCLSPRFMYDELKKSANRALSGNTRNNVDASGDGGLNWLMYELLWRDFFRLTGIYPPGELRPFDQRLRWDTSILDPCFCGV